MITMNKLIAVAGLLYASLALPVHATDERGTVENDLRSHPNFSGRWILNEAASEDPEAKIQAAREMMRTSRGTRGGMEGAGGQGGRGSGGMRGGRQGGAGSPGGSATRDREAMTDLRAAIAAPRVLDLAHDDPMLSISAASERPRRVFTDFRGAVVSASGGLHQTVTAAGWEGEVLVVETTRDSGPRIVERLRLNASTGQLELSTDITSSASFGPVTIMRVYDRADAQATIRPGTAPRSRPPSTSMDYPRSEL